ncbi:MAG: aspartyl protease, partial [Microcystis aeruginosa]
MVEPAIIAEDMGKIYTSITVINRADQIRAEDGIIAPEQIRSLTLENVLVDT